VDGIREAARDPQWKNMVVRFLRKFWSTRGQALAFDVAAAGTHEVLLGFYFVKIGWVPHKFPSMDDVCEAVRDPQCKNMVVQFLRKFWLTRSRALAFDVAAAGTHEVLLGFCFVIFFYLLLFCSLLF
jgi:uncharacterized membrane protein YhfC